MHLHRLTDTGLRPKLHPQLDIRPTTDILVVRQREGDARGAAMAQWWLVPPWVKERSVSYAMFDARAETIDAKRSFASPFRHRRRLIPTGAGRWQSAPKAQGWESYLRGAQQ